MKPRSGDAIPITQETQKLALFGLSGSDDQSTASEQWTNKMAEAVQVAKVRRSLVALGACWLPRAAVCARLCIQLARKMLKVEGMPVSQTTYPASFGQRRLWFLDQLEPGTAAYNMARAFRVTGPLDIPVLRRAFEAIVRRHESLRTVFDSVDGEARQLDTALHWYGGTIWGCGD